MRVLSLLFAALLAACASTGDIDLEDIPLEAVEKVDLDRYMGRWHLIANIPYFAERGNLAPYVDYRRLDQTHIEDLFSAYDAFGEPPFTKRGKIEIHNTENWAEGTITFFPFPGQDFSILFIDEFYQYTLIGHPSRDYAWLFARGPEMPDEVYEDMLETLEENEFDIRRVKKIPQRPEQIGLPGFQ